MADEFGEMLKAMFDLNKVMELFNKLYTEVEKCKHCGKGSSEEVRALLSDSSSGEALKKLLCPKHKKLFEELEQKAKAAKESN